MRAAETGRPRCDNSTEISPRARPSGSPRRTWAPTVERGGDVGQQGHPAAAMIDDDDPFAAAERSGEDDSAVGGGDEAGTARRGERQPARADAAGGNFAKALDEPGGEGQLVGERRRSRLPDRAERARRRRAERGELRGDARGGAAVLRLAAERFGLLAARQSDVADDERLARQRGGERRARAARARRTASAVRRARRGRGRSRCGRPGSRARGGGPRRARR